MLGLLRRLFGKAGVDTRNEVPASRPLPAARVSAAKAVDGGENGGDGGAVPASPAGDARDSAFFCREALVGRDQKVVGYEFGYPQHLQSRFMEKRVRVRQYYDDALLRHLAGLELDSFLGDRLALVEISHASLDHPSLAALLHRNIALLLSFPEAGALDARMLAQVTVMAAQLRGMGARIGVKWQSGWPRKADDFPLLAQADFIQIAWPDCAGMDSAAFFSDLRQVSALGAGTRQMPLRLIAGELGTPDDFWQCYRLGADFFRGAFINSRDRGKRSKSTVNRLRVLQLLNKLRQDADIPQLEEELKQDPVLSYRVLTYANSPLLGMATKITHLGHAMTIIGRNNLYRWLASLLFNVADPGYYEWALTEQALSRAALMERLGKNTAGAAPDALFLTGLFSLLDQLMGKPMEELATQVQLAEDIQAALVRREGVLARFLALAEACERMDPETIARHAEALGLSSRTVSLAVFDALSWAHAMTRLNGEQEAGVRDQESGIGDQ
ncbi:MAG: HDOD domain-containing protein [Candidatus Accumulibacter sp.]|jgi:EAL and modified HD-GYP domain-containing signal transduction protein|nr:HDOD domain-containing protein [Accumulibacter sp.]